MFNTTFNLLPMNCKLYNRRQAVSAIASLMVTSACTPLKVLFTNKKPVEKAYDRTLKAFSEAIIPGIQTEDPGLTDIYYDPAYPFAPYIKMFTAALDKASVKKFNSEDFSELSMERREAIVEEMLSKGGIIKQFSIAALFLIQLSVYTGLYNSAGICELIDFKCMDSETESYPDLSKYSCDPRTRDGNPI